MSIIQIRPIEGKKWHGKTGVESFTRPKTVSALVDPERMVYCTGLTEEEEKKYGELLKADLSKQFSIDTPHTFWDSKMAETRLENRTQFFDTNNPLEYVKIKYLKKSKYVANSMKEYEDGLFPEATHVIFDESEEVDVKASKVAIKNQAILAVNSLSKDKKVELILILSADEDYLKGKNLKGKSDNFITIEMDKIIEKRAEDVVRFINMDKEYLSTYALVLEALQKSVLTKEGHKIKYHESVIGQDVQDTIIYLTDKVNQDLKLRILSQVN